MSLEFFKESYAGSIKKITLGKGDKAVTVGGESCYPFYLFEGEMPCLPKIAMEVWDMEPVDWPQAALAPFKDVVSDPAAWAKKCVDTYGAELIVLQLKSADPNSKDASAADVTSTVKKVLDAINVPLIVWGTANPQKDEEIFKKIAEECQGANLTIGPVEDKNHKGIGASAMGYGHTIISSSPIDVNLAKQVNILLENLGMPMDKVIIDPTTGGLGYGMEYSYSVMERLRMAAMSQGDDKLQLPMINNLGNEVWKCKEAKQTVEEAPSLGDPERRAILMEAVGAVSYLMAGSDILIMRHPEAITLVKSFINLAMTGGNAQEVSGITKKCDDVDIDYISLSPALDLTIEEDKKAAPKAVAPAKKVAPAAAPKKEGVKAATEAVAPAKKVAPAAAPKKEGVKAVAAEKIDTEAKIEAKLKAEAEAKANAKAKAEAKLKAEAKAKAQEETDARAKRDQEDNELRLKRAEEKEKSVQKVEKKTGKVSMTPASIQLDQNGKILDKLNRLHRKIPLY
ncbi:MAG: acetyl-CoA decarbonylase/synthase complex subunit delta [Deltaproteobacteria bacterium]|nr:acetyl-CoA decarbonylase/synthase complex subunit delta [Deltaproteobacteria bacterium]